MTLPLRPTVSLDDPNQKRRDRETLNDILTFRFDDSRIQTPAEIAAGVTPVNYAYAPCDLRRYGANPDGTTVSTSALVDAAAVSAAGGGDVIVEGGTYRVDANTTVTGTWKFCRGGKITVDSGDTLTMPVPIAPLTTIFEGAGIVVFTNDVLDMRYTYSEWFGALKNGSANDTPAINKCLYATPDSAVMMLTAGSYGIGQMGTNALGLTTTNGIQVTKSVTVRGYNMQGTALTALSGVTLNAILTVNNTADNVTLQDFGLNNLAGNTVDYGLYLKGVRRFVRRIYNGFGASKKFSTAVISTDRDNTSYHVCLEQCYLAVPAGGEETPIGVYFARGHTMTLDEGCFISGFPTGVKVGGSTGGPTGTSVLGFYSAARIESFSGNDPAYPGADDAIGIDLVEVDGFQIFGNFGMAGDEDAASADQRAVVLRTARGGFISAYMDGAGVCTGMIDIANSAAKGWHVKGCMFNRVDGYGVVASGSGSLYSGEVGTCSAPSPTTGVWNNSFTPTLAFGGASTGITYASQFGRIARDGDYVIASLRLVLSNDGSATGTVRVLGLPVASANVTNNDVSYSIFANGLTGVTGSLMGLHQLNNSALRIYYLGTGSATELTEANFTNSTELYIVARYYAPVS